jgi:hypothetical protein
VNGNLVQTLALLRIAHQKDLGLPGEFAAGKELNSDIGKGFCVDSRRTPVLPVADQCAGPKSRVFPRPECPSP